MQEFYVPLKFAHVALALTSISFFLVRAMWAIRGSHLLMRRWVKISPHLIDSLLLLTAVLLATLSHQYPLTHPWLTAKVIALCCYIIFGNLAIKRAPTARAKTGFMLLALLTFTYMIAVALNKSPTPFF